MDSGEYQLGLKEITMIHELAVTDPWYKIQFKKNWSGGDWKSDIGKFKAGQYAYVKRNIELPSKFPTWWVIDSSTGYLLNIDEDMLKFSIVTIRQENGDRTLADSKTASKIDQYFRIKLATAKKARTTLKGR